LAASGPTFVFADRPVKLDRIINKASFLLGSLRGMDLYICVQVSGYGNAEKVHWAIAF